MRFAYPLFCMHGKARERRRLIWRCLTIATQNHLLNEEIREPEVRLISEEGEQLGVMSGEQALRIAEEREMDLVLISPQAKPPVCKIMDYGKFRFEQTKKEKEARKNQRVIEIKEVRMSPGIDENDFNVKLKNAQKFLPDGNRVKVTVRFRGREMAHTDIGEQLLHEVCRAVCRDRQHGQEPQAGGTAYVHVPFPQGHASKSSTYQ